MNERKDEADYNDAAIAGESSMRSVIAENVERRKKVDENCATIDRLLVNREFCV